MTQRERNYNENVKPHLEQIGFWVRDGKTMESIAESLGVPVRTLYDYKKAFAEFAEVFKKDRDFCDNTVINSVYKSAVGYDVELPKEVYKYIYHADGTVEERLERREVNRIHIAPNPTAQKMWLNARKRAEWGDMIEAIEQENGGIVLMPEKDIIDESGTENQ